MAESRVEKPVPCRDPDCPGHGHPDGDAETFLYVCDTCGYEYGHQMIRQPDDGTCAVGVSAETRRVFPGPAEPVMLQIGRRPDA